MTRFCRFVDKTFSFVLRVGSSGVARLVFGCVPGCRGSSSRRRPGLRGRWWSRGAAGRPWGRLGAGRGLRGAGLGGVASDVPGRVGGCGRLCGVTVVRRGRAGRRRAGRCARRRCCGRGPGTLKVRDPVPQALWSRLPLPGPERDEAGQRSSVSLQGVLATCHTDKMTRFCRLVDKTEIRGRRGRFRGRPGDVSTAWQRIPAARVAACELDRACAARCRCRWPHPGCGRARRCLPGAGGVTGVVVTGGIGGGCRASVVRRGRAGRWGAGRSARRRSGGRGRARGRPA